LLASKEQPAARIAARQSAGMPPRGRWATVHFREQMEGLDIPFRALSTMTGSRQQPGLLEKRRCDGPSGPQGQSTVHTVRGPGCLTD